jgi:TP901 family phage tail tape measure protein
MEERQILLDIRVRAKDAQKQLEEVNKRLVQNRNSQKELERQLKAGEVSFDQYAQAITAVKLDSSELRKEGASLQRQLLNTSKATNEAEGSNEQLKAQLGLLTQEYNKLSRAEKQNEKAGGELQLRIRSISDELKGTESALGNNTRNVGNYASAFDGLGLSIGGVSASMLATGGLVAGVSLVSDVVKKSVGIFIEFNQSLQTLAAISGASSEELIKLELDARRLGETTQFTAGEVVKLQTEFARVGLDPTQIINATEATLALAIATGEDLTRSSEVVAATLGGYQLDATETARITDIMAESFNRSALDLDRFAESTKTVAPIANLANIEIEEVTAALGALSNAGISGSIAGTGLRRVISELSDENSELAEVLGFSVKSSEDFTRAFSVLSEKGIDNARAIELVGREASSVFSVLVQSADQVETLADQFDNASGAAQRTADIVGDSLRGDLNQANSALEGVAITIGEFLAPAIRATVQGFTAFILALKAIPEFISENKDEIIALGVAILALNSAQIAASVSSLRLAAVQKISTVATRAAAIAQAALNLVLNLNPIGIVITALAALGFALKKLYDNSETFRAGIDATFSAVKKVFTNVFGSIVKQVTGFSDILLGAFSFDGERIKKGLKSYTEGLKGITIGIADGVGEAFTNGFDDSIERSKQGALDSLKDGQGEILDSQENAAKKQDEIDRQRLANQSKLEAQRAEAAAAEREKQAAAAEKAAREREAREAADLKKQLDAQKEAIEARIALEELAIIRIDQARREGLADSDALDAQELERKKRKIELETQLALVGIDQESAKTRLIIVKAEEEKEKIAREYRDRRLQAISEEQQQERDLLRDGIEKSAQLELERIAKREELQRQEFEKIRENEERIRQLKEETLSAVENIQAAIANGDIEGLTNIAAQLVETFQDAGLKASDKFLAGLGGVAGAAAGILGEVAANIEVVDRESAERQRKLQIAQLIFAGISSAAQALFRSMAIFPPPAGQIIGGVQAALIGGITAVQVSKLKSEPLGFADGGFTGDGVGMPDSSGYKIAGFVHENEYVTPEWQLQSPQYAPLIAQLEQGRLRGYATGGFTGARAASVQVDNQVSVGREVLRAIESMPAPVVSVKEITGTARRVQVKQNIGSI